MIRDAHLLISDPGSGSGFLFHPGSRIQRLKKLRIPDTATQHCFKLSLDPTFFYENKKGNNVCLPL
jgi:hypothetical protein